MTKLIDLTGQKFNRLTVIERAENRQCCVPVWRCVCDCGKEKFVRGKNLRSGAVKSCGCLLKDNVPAKCNGLSHTRLYRKWWGMKRRCGDPNDTHYKDYGGRGIKVCEEWKSDFLAFYEWAMSTQTDESLTLERIDVNGDYCPENCTWATRKEQANNRRMCRMITYQGRTQNLMQWCTELGLNYQIVHNRLNRHHWSFERAISQPVRESR